MAIEEYGTIKVFVPDFSKDEVKALRARTTLTQFAFAVKYQIPIYSIQAWESGKRRPSVMRRFALQAIKDELDGKKPEQKIGPY